MVYKHQENPLVVVLSGPSGVGKDAVLSRLRKRAFPIEQVVTTTTRPIRLREVDGVDYRFLSIVEFQDLLSQNGFLEWANVYGNFYGVPRFPVREALAQGRDVIMKVDVQGARTIKEKIPDAVFIFLMPPSIDDLVARLNRRHTESPDALVCRLSAAEEELQSLPLFDYVVVNEDGHIDEAVRKIMSIVRAEKCRLIQRNIKV
ncbi:MAG: guanylate kinase [Chloroflexi bacterium]|nr:guanylate kinase [Chloroflexota bacterium]